NESLKEGGRSSTESAGRRRWRDLLVVSELAMALMLLVGAGLLIKSFWRLQQVDVGVNPEQVLTMEIALRGSKYPQSDNVSSFYGQLVERVEALPGVRAVAVSNSLPPDQLAFSSDFTIEGRPVDTDQSAMVADFPIVSTGYFQALGLPLRRGRYFSESDSRDAPRVVLINEAMQRRFFSGEEPVGRRVNIGSQRDPAWAEIVGVVGDVKYTGLGSETQPAIYQPSVQNPSWAVFLIVKTESGDPLSLATAVRNEVRALDHELPVRHVRTMEQLLAASLVQPRFRTTLITVFALLALILASIGIYGVISYTVTQRTREIGIRMAMGARPKDVMRLLLKQAMLLTSAGVGVGLVAALALTRLMESLLFRVTATDPVTFILIALALAGVALAACYLPARRATRVDPMVALRYE
ncbi:MAG TPA: FtsX-like permease family protein, partial [Blastocatellia bacterium]|nr:FtsX-like permease family protein [Blastocatellia bacterium]